MRNMPHPARLDDDEEEEREDPKATPAAAATPKLIEETLFKKRVVLITGQINDRVARLASERLLALGAASRDPIDVFISSPGGHVESGDMIHDVIRFIDAPVRTIGTGWVASAGALIFVAVPKERRFCLPNTRFMLHHPSGGAWGQASDIAIAAEQITQMRKRFYKIFAEATGQTIERLEQDLQRDFWLNTQQALDYGLLGKVVQHQRDLG
jgi:ATP-dependent Clp protease protease subunit